MSYIFKKSFEEVFTLERLNYELQKENQNPISSFDDFFDFAPDIYLFRYQNMIINLELYQSPIKKQKSSKKSYIQT